MMKQIKTSLLLLIILICACTNNPSSISDQIMEDIFNGKFGFLQVAQGAILYDSKSRITDRVLEHMKAEQDKSYDITTESFHLQPMMFDFPKNIKSYKFLDVWDNPDNKMLKIEDLSRRYYKDNDYLETIYKNYETFKSEKIKECEGLMNCDYNEEKEFIKYEEVVPEKRFEYRVETISSIFKVTICMYQVNDEWKVGAIFKKNI